MKFLHPFIFILCFGCLSSSCTRTLNVQTHYITHEYLASYHVKTPDPLLSNPPIGEDLIVDWSLSKSINIQNPPYLKITMRFRDHTEKKLTIPIKKMKMTYVYSHINEAFCKHGSILTYQVQILEGDHVIESWEHPLWVNLITIKPVSD